jgi:glycosyltransferase involved in cell wall biosynthesis
MALRRSMRAARPAVVYTAHGFHFHQNGSSVKNLAFKTLERVAGNWTDFLITINRTDECEALRAGIVGRDRLIMMPGIGLDLEHFSPDCVSRAAVEAIRRRFRIPPDTPAFVMIAEFIPRKRHTDAIQAMTAMQNRRAHLILIGDGPLLGSITAQVVKNNLEARVHIAGQQQDVRPFIAAARASVLPSSQEGLPRSVMESLACGVPAIGSNIRGTRDLITGGGGVVFEPENIAELAGLLDWFADHPQEAAAMGEQGRRSMTEYGISRLVRMHEQLYARAIPGGR